MCNQLVTESVAQSDLSANKLCESVAITKFAAGLNLSLSAVIAMNIARTSWTRRENERCRRTSKLRSELLSLASSSSMLMLIIGLF